VRLRKDDRELRMEAPSRTRPPSARRRMPEGCVHPRGEGWWVTLLARALRVSRSGFYTWRLRPSKDAAAAGQVGKEDATPALRQRRASKRPQGPELATAEGSG